VAIDDIEHIEYIVLNVFNRLDCALFIPIANIDKEDKSMAGTPDSVIASSSQLDELINMDRKEVSLRALSDKSLYELELEQLFGKVWNLLGHESEIPNAGDYVVRPIGEDQVIVARDRDDKIYASLNVCEHRGMRVALSEQGNSLVHRCIYHGWAYKPNGDFIGAPVPRAKMHGDICEKAELGLKQARVALYGGLIFATWEQDGPSLEEFLGESKFYFDMLFNRTDSGLEVLGPPQRARVHTNWKAPAEQSSGDGFHTLTLHRSMIELGVLGDPDGDGSEATMDGINVCANGHALRCIPAEQSFAMVKGMDITKMGYEERLAVLPPPGITPELLPELKKHLNDEQIRLLAEAPPQVGGMFPNIGFLFLYTPAPDGTMSSCLALHLFSPKGPDEIEFWTWLFAEKDVPVEVKEKMLRSSINAVGTTGLYEQDDAETWPHMYKSSLGTHARKNVTMKYQALLGENKPEGWPGGGKVFAGFGKDDTQWEWWKEYRKWMAS
jgi:nitrite reductase/ring-hydroxylating ferredoxin subunit